MRRSINHSWIPRRPPQAGTPTAPLAPTFYRPAPEISLPWEKMQQPLQQTTRNAVRIPLSSADPCPEDVFPVVHEESTSFEEKVSKEDLGIESSFPSDQGLDEETREE